MSARARGWLKRVRESVEPTGGKWEHRAPRLRHIGVLLILAALVGASQGSVAGADDGTNWVRLEQRGNGTCSCLSVEIDPNYTSDVQEAWFHTEAYFSSALLSGHPNNNWNERFFDFGGFQTSYDMVTIGYGMVGGVPYWMAEKPGGLPNYFSAITPNTWYRLEVHISVTDEIYEMRIDGDLVGSDTYPPPGDSADVLGLNAMTAYAPLVADPNDTPDTSAFLGVGNLAYSLDGWISDGYPVTDRWGFDAIDFATANANYPDPPYWESDGGTGEVAIVSGSPGPAPGLPSASPPTPQCANSTDDDSDGDVDEEDAGCSSAEDNSEAPDPPEPPTQVDFDPPVTVAQALTWAHENYVEPEQLVGRIAAGDDTVTLFYQVEEGATDEEIEGDTPEELFANLEENDEDLSSYYTSSPPIVAMLVNDEPVLSFSNNLAFPRVNVTIQAPLASTQGAMTESSVPESCTQPWWPDQGLIRTDTSESSSARYVFQRFSWSTSNLDNLQCDSDVTYEPDASYTKQSGLFLGKKQAWASATNLPASYLDTQASDKPCCSVYTIGTDDADQLAARPKRYWTFILTTPGLAPGDRGEPQGQLGYHRFSLCPHYVVQWCVFPRATEPALLDEDPNIFFEHVVPGADTWTH